MVAWQTELILQLQAEEVPFVIRNTGQMADLASKWTRRYLSAALEGRTITASTSNSSRHMFISGKNARAVGSEAPVTTQPVTLAELLNMQAVGGEGGGGEGNTTYGVMDSSANGFLEQDLSPLMRGLGWNR